MIIISISAAAILLSDGFKDLGFEIKPFICPRCLTVWLSLITYIYLHINKIEVDLSILFLPYVLTKIINKYLWS